MASAGATRTAICWWIRSFSTGGDARDGARPYSRQQPAQSIDNRVWGELLTLLGQARASAAMPSNTAKVNQAITVHENTRSQDYVQYWQIRNSQKCTDGFRCGMAIHGQRR